jgi:AcrR family transcriptional regulator
MAPKIVDKDQKRIDIARTALDLFARKGFEKTSIREITTQVGMGKGTFYDYFDDKKAILTEIARLVFEEWSLRASEALTGVDDPLDQLRTLAMSSVKMTSDFEQLMLVYVDMVRLGAEDQGRSDFMKMFKDYILMGRRFIADIIRAGQKKKKVGRNVDPDTAAMNLIAQIDGLCFHYLLFRSDLNLTKIMKTFMDQFIKGLA